VEAGASEGSLTLTGDNTTLRVNPDSARSDGISLDAAGRYGYLSIEPGVSIETFGRQNAIAISNSTCQPAILYDSVQSYLSGDLAVGDFGLLTQGDRPFAAADTIVVDDLGEPARAVYFAGGWEEITGLSKYSQLCLTDGVSGRPIYLVQGGEVTAEATSRAHLHYDRESNTLTLDDYTGGILSARMMGGDFTLRYDGDNALDAIRCHGHSSVVGGSLHIDGSYGASLVVNEGRQWPVGIWLSANESDSALAVRWGTGLDVYGTETAVLVEKTSAEWGIATEPITGISGEVFHIDTADLVLGDWYISPPAFSGTTPGTHATFRNLITLDCNGTSQLIAMREPLWRKAPYDNPFVDEVHIDVYSLIDSGVTHTVTNEGRLPVYVYLQKYTRRNEPTLIEVAKGDDWEVTELVDMQGKYYCGGGVYYLTTDGSWKGDFAISGADLSSDTLLVNHGESAEVSLPEDGTDSIYILYAATYDPERDYSWWLHIPVKFSGT